jgi:hypothetical protein
MSVIPLSPSFPPLLANTAAAWLKHGKGAGWIKESSDFAAH